ncbi:hypothetical protein [Pedobacter sp. Leaf176]|uniref:hypothetical protein n=1 Tax=Pedobacter sp. Leaf176 TaxID=1736286 RepID=UPI0006F6B648|nr:hypothetical protein [Pedobacter sp. Leaf176]KQR72726.1 hypothetical protein ASF92_05495 [Pedobacter sp. Leaf176]
MKKLVVICLLAIAAVGCKPISYYEPKFEIGMTEKSFKESNKKAELVSSNGDGTKIYRTITNTWIPRPEPYSFFYFYQGKLMKFIKSERGDDYKFI